MLGVRLKPEEEERLSRHARELGRPKSAMVRDWIVERLDKESTDALVQAAIAQVMASAGDGSSRDERLSDWLAALDEEDGGYDWGPAGPPA